MNQACSSTPTQAPELAGTCGCPIPRQHCLRGTLPSIAMRLANTIRIVPPLLTCPPWRTLIYCRRGSFQTFLLQGGHRNWRRRSWSQSFMFMHVSAEEEFQQDAWAWPAGIHLFRATTHINLIDMHDSLQHLSITMTPLVLFVNTVRYVNNFFIIQRQRNGYRQKKASCLEFERSKRVRYLQYVNANKGKSQPSVTPHISPTSTLPQYASIKPCSNYVLICSQ